MEPVTHMLTGAILARAGFNRRAAYATWAMAIAAELPDIDITWGALGPVTGFMHHRGITHTFLALPFEAFLVTAGFWAVHRFRKRIPDATVSWLWMFCGCWLALLSHLLLDWTNNYGIRPFFPFNPRWYAGSFVFIFEPVMFALLLIALIAPALFGLINSEVGSRRQRFPGRGWAIFALVGIATLYVFRYTERDRALGIAAANEPAGTTRIFASPHPLNPFLWSTVTETPALYQLATIDTRRQLMLPTSPANTLYKPPVSLPILVAKRTYLGQIYLDWSSFPVITEAPVTKDPQHPLTEVTFADARFLYDAGVFIQRNSPPLTGTVTLDMAAPEGRRIEEMRMNDRIQR